jgi:predicted transcriptional regulator
VPSPEIERVVAAAAARDDANAEFVAAIKAACVAGCSVRSVAAAAGISPSYVSRIASGERGARRGRDT